LKVLEEMPLLLWILCLHFALGFDESYLNPNDTRVHYIGRHYINKSIARFDWVGTGFQIQVVGNATIWIDFNGGGCRYAVLIGSRRHEFTDVGSRQSHRLGHVSNETLTFMKITESNFCKSCNDLGAFLYNITLNGKGKAVHVSNIASRRIDVYGDSDSAGFGISGSQNLTILCEKLPLHFTDFEKGWVSNVASILNAETHVQAISGAGVVRGAADGPILPPFLNRTLRSNKNIFYDASSWVPSIIIIYIGSNDFVNVVAPTRKEFIEAYSSMVRYILSPFAKPPPMLHICGGETTPCDLILNISHSTGGYYTATGDVGIAKGGCLMHRNATQQLNLAKHLSPIIANITGW